MPYTAPSPDTDIYLCYGVMWDKDYNHVRLFDNEAERINYLYNRAAKVVQNATYQRDNGTIRVPYVKEAIQNCDYLYYVNKSAGNKYYYAFITGIDFINFNVSEIHFEIDMFQTFFSEALIYPCFVEREIVHDDVFGKYLLPENLELGEYVNNSAAVGGEEANRKILGDYPVIIQAVTEDVGGSLPGGNFGGLYNGLLYYAASLDNASVITTRISNYMKAGKANAIVSMYMFPGELLGLSVSNPSINRFLTPSDLRTAQGGQLVTPFGALDGYTPKNKKLYTYPYRALCVWGAGGNESVYRYEYFENLYQPLFTAFSALGGSAPIMYAPKNYKGYPLCVDEAGSMPPYPQCSWLTDNYQNWLAQNWMSINYNVGKSVATGVIGAVSSAVTGNVAGVVNSIVSPLDTIAGNMIAMEEHKIVPDSANGSTASTSAYYTVGQRSLFIVPKCITAAQAQKIDNYFTMFGYKINALKTPDIRGRKLWNYVKTAGADISGAIPVEAQQTFVRCFDRGITFWHTDAVFDYTGNNYAV